jgi:hypothetical protein
MAATGVFISHRRDNVAFHKMVLRFYWERGSCLFTNTCAANVVKSANFFLPPQPSVRHVQPVAAVSLKSCCRPMRLCPHRRHHICPGPETLPVAVLRPHRHHVPDRGAVAARLTNGHLKNIFWPKSWVESPIFRDFNIITAIATYPSFDNGQQSRWSRQPGLSRSRQN